MLRSDFVAEIDLLVDRLAQEVGLPAEHAHAEPAEHVDVLVAVDVPDAAASRAFDHDLVRELLRDRAEAIHDARVGHVTAVLGRVLLRAARARVVALRERGERFALLPRHRVCRRVDARDGAEGLLDVVGHRACGLVVALRLRRGRWTRHCRRRDLGRLCYGRNAPATEQRELLRHDLELLLDDLTHVRASHGRSCHSGSDSGDGVRRFVRRDARWDGRARVGRWFFGVGRELLVEHRDELRDRREVLHDLTERDLHSDAALHL